MEDLIKELITYYFNEAVENIESLPFGLTNYSQVLTVNNNKYVARIYDNHSKNLEKLKFEIELTTFLEQNNLPFKLPGFLIAKTGDRFIELSNGQFGSVVRFIEGEVPDLTQVSDVKEYGKTVGEISVAFKKFKSDVLMQEIKFYKIYNLHQLSNERSVKRFIDQPPFEIESNQLSILIDSLQAVQRNESIIDNLPKQIVHHDILIFNLLIDNQTRKMSGVLDFDFASYDVRALELAICINHLLQFDNDSLANLKLFLDEYSQYMTLTEEEIKWIPFLMQMYYVSLICIYIGQYYSGREIEEYFRFILNQLVIRKQWIEQNEYEFIETLRLRLN
ncbi:phosphotransferase [Paenibacillus sp. OSY-SE]|uniref:phosphotransferase n=1 Tax=Paenibacillus sp. OSY-SE TaxID=1196323 RepID=UPI0002D6129F|nr:phosphotransferase [Paenibacillus sp. OSY-SE]